MSPDSKETELGSSDQEAFPSPGKNSRIVLVLCNTWKCVPTAVFGGLDNFELHNSLKGFKSRINRHLLSVGSF